MKVIIYISMISIILLISGCVEQQSQKEKVSPSITEVSPSITQIPNASILEKIEILRKTGDNKSIETLILMFGDKDESVQQYAMTAVFSIGEPAVEQLIQSTKSQDPNIRICSAIVLGKIGDKRAIEPVKQLLNDTDANVRKEAQIAYNELMKIK